MSIALICFCFNLLDTWHYTHTSVATNPIHHPSLTCLTIHTLLSQWHPLRHRNYMHITWNEHKHIIGNKTSTSPHSVCPFIPYCHCVILLDMGIMCTEHGITYAHYWQQNLYITNLCVSIHTLLSLCHPLRHRNYMHITWHEHKHIIGNKPSTSPHSVCPFIPYYHCGITCVHHQQQNLYITTLCVSTQTRLLLCHPLRHINNMQRTWHNIRSTSATKPLHHHSLCLHTDPAITVPSSQTHK